MMLYPGAGYPGEYFPLILVGAVGEYEALYEADAEVLQLLSVGAEVSTSEAHLSDVLTLMAVESLALRIA